MMQAENPERRGATTSLAATLDEESRQLLEAISLSPPLDLLALPPEEARAAARALRFEAEPTGPIDISEVVAVGSDGHRVPVRTYRPRTPAKLPCLVYLHGGGWRVGDLDTVDHLGRVIADRASCVVVSVDYRLAPEHRFPAAVDDATAALEWVVNRAASMHVDAARIGIAGESAGGNLAAAAALRAVASGGPAVALLALVYPVTNHRFDTPSYEAYAEGYSLTRNAMIGFWDNYLSDPDAGQHPNASVLGADLHGLPPSLIMTAGHDPLRDEGEAMARRLDNACVPTKCIRFAGTIHGFLVRYQVLPAGRLALATLIDVIERTLHNADLSWICGSHVEIISNNATPG